MLAKIIAETKMKSNAKKETEKKDISPGKSSKKQENPVSTKKSYSPGYKDCRQKYKSSQVSSSIITAKRNIVMRSVALLKLQCFFRGCIARNYYALLKAKGKGR